MLQVKAAVWAVYLGGDQIASVGMQFGISAKQVKKDLVDSGQFPPEITVKEVAGFGTLPTTTQ